MKRIYPQTIILLCYLVLPLKIAFADLDSDAETIFNWAESNFPDIIAPAATTQVEGDWRYRYYSATETYLGVSNSREVAAFGDLFGGPDARHQ